MDGNITANNEFNELKGTIVAIPRVDETLTKTGFSADAKVTRDELDKRVKKADVVDNLTTEDATKPLSANQGAVIKKQLDAINLSQAGTVGYNNTASGLSATNMQSAIDELAESVTAQGGYIDDLASQMDTFEEDFLSKNGGGMVTGSITFQNAKNGHGGVMKNNSETADYGTQLMDVDKNGKVAKATVSVTTGFTYTDANANIHDVHHEGTKPFMEYQGNGSATPRTIATKGIGRLALVYCSTHQALVSPKGADVVDLTTGERKWIDSGKVNFLNGNLNITTSNAAFNTANETYYAQVL